MSNIEDARLLHEYERESQRGSSEMLFDMIHNCTASVIREFGARELLQGRVIVYPSFVRWILQLILLDICP